MSLDWLVLQNLVEAAPEGVVVCAAQEGWPVVYLNHAFEQLTGYSRDELLGRSLACLQQGENQQEGLSLVRAALRDGIACRVVLNNYKKDGTSFVNELQLLPIRDAQGKLTHFASYHRASFASNVATIGDAVQDGSLSTQRLLAHVREDRQTGLLRRSYFEDLLRRDFAMAQREQKPLTVIMFEIDQASAYREVFGPAGSEQTFKRVARAIAGSFRRASDLCARWEDTQIVAAILSANSTQAQQMADNVIMRVRELGIHHPRSTSRFVTVSAGVCCGIPELGDHCTDFIAHALQHLQGQMQPLRKHAL